VRLFSYQPSVRLPSQPAALPVSDNKTRDFVKVNLVVKRSINNKRIILFSMAITATVTRRYHIYINLFRT